MALEKRAISVNFTQGVSTKADKNQIPIGTFLELDNMVFTEVGLLKKRDGNKRLANLPDGSSTLTTTYNSNLVAIGTKIQALVEPTNAWINRGDIDLVNVDTLSLIKNNTNQSMVDTAISGGLVCTTYTDNVPLGTSTRPAFKYAIADLLTGQNVVSPAELTVVAASVSHQARVFSLGQYFVLVYDTYNGSSYSLKYQTININTPGIISTSTTWSTSYTPSGTGSFDGVVANNSLYLSWNGSSGGLKSAYLTSGLTLSSVVGIGSSSSSIVSVTADNSGSTPVIWTTYWNSTSSAGYAVAVNPILNTVLPQTLITTAPSGAILNIASTAYGGVLNAFLGLAYSYTYNASIPTNRIVSVKMWQATGSITAEANVSRSVGLGSKACLIGTTSYFMSVYQSAYQPTYFLLKYDTTGRPIAKIAYGNGGGYYTDGLPSCQVIGSTFYSGYLIKDLVQSVNKNTNVSSSTQNLGIYTQTGINLAKIKFTSAKTSAVETAQNLNLNGGFVWNYDGYTISEQNMFLYPDSVATSVAATSGSMSAQTYFYQATYEWSDNQGNIYRSAPSIPVAAVTTTGSSSVTVFVPTLRLTYKTENPVKIVIYRWSTAQQNYYQVTSLTSPVLNNKDADNIAFLDTKPDDVIIGNNLLYTTGGVVENTSPPAADDMTLFDNRMWLINSENKNQLCFSKQIIENVPVEMSDLFTLFVPPTTSTKITTGPIKCIAPMDDKLIVFKANAIYYFNGTGPDNTGANSQYSQPVLITSTVGCSNPRSIVFSPSGLMFQSDKGIWLLGRDLSTSYIGAPVERYNNIPIVAALALPGTNSIRFDLATGGSLLFDYFVNQWATFSGIKSVSSTLYKNLPTFVNSQGYVFQETPGLYLDDSNPVLMSFKTGWLNLAGLQGYQRLYKIFMLGEYKTPHKFSLGVAYDYDPSRTQFINVTPDNYSAPWGVGSTWGSSSVYGGASQREQWQLNPERQQCQSFQLTFNEYFDASIGVVAGAGLTISGFNLVSGFKAAFPKNLGKTNKKG